MPFTVGGCNIIFVEMLSKAYISCDLFPAYAKYYVYASSHKFAKLALFAYRHNGTGVFYSFVLVLYRVLLLQCSNSD